MEKEETYGDLPARLHECFCQFVECYNLPNFYEIKKLEPVVVPMLWQTVNNSTDCGIFVMRHMETYMGNANKFQSGLGTEMDNQKALLNKLRVIYCHHILTWAGNQKRDRVLDGIAQVDRSKKVAASVDGGP